MGLRLGTYELQYLEDELDSPEGMHSIAARDDLDTTSLSQGRGASVSIEAQCSTSQSRPSRRVWTEEDRSDLNKLGTMVKAFLRVPRGSQQPKRLLVSLLLRRLWILQDQDQAPCRCLHRSCEASCFATDTLPFCTCIIFRTADQ